MYVCICAGIYLFKYECICMYVCMYRYNNAPDQSIKNSCRDFAVVTQLTLLAGEVCMYVCMYVYVFFCYLYIM